MRPSSQLIANPDGFSLIEVIVTIVIGAIASVLLIQFMGGNMERSVAPLVRVDQSYRLTTVMENITAHYKNLLLMDASPLATLEADINSNTPNFGVYTATLSYIEFNAGNESPCSTDCRVLRVDLQNGEHRLTSLFTR
jgi:prepilin-type N-terminal cleavage/methylation domain-containing protein